jgi:hypothetical protein
MPQEDDHEKPFSLVPEFPFGVELRFTNYRGAVYRGIEFYAAAAQYNQKYTG